MTNELIQCESFQCIGNHEGICCIDEVELEPDTRVVFDIKCKLPKISDL